MNWYKKAQKSYLDIGRYLETNCALWAWIDGKFLIHNNCDTDHFKIWPDLEDNDYRGRFEIDENGQKNVSVVNPFQGRDLPNKLYSLLYDEFGDDIRILEF